MPTKQKQISKKAPVKTVAQKKTGKPSGQALVTVEAECIKCGDKIKFEQKNLNQTPAEALGMRGWGPSIKGWQCQKDSGMLPGRMMRKDRAM